MKIAYASIYSAEDPNTWSGLNRSMAECLRRQGCEVTLLEPLYHPQLAWLSKVRAKLRTFIAGRRFLWSRDQALLRHYGAALARQLDRVDCDVVFSPGTEAIAYLPERIRTPVVFWTDAPFAPLVNYYAWYSGLAQSCVGEATETDTRALRRATLACYSSTWAANAAVSFHRAPPDKLAVLPFGANLDAGVAGDEITALVQSRRQAPWRFLFVGVDWVRKGGDLALAVVTELNRLGLASELDLVGCLPPEELQPLPPFVRVHGFVNRREAAGRRQLAELYRRATFFILPSQAEAFGVVFAEAAAHAVPVIATLTGGIPSVVADDTTGHLLPRGATVGDYIKRITATMAPARYEAMARAIHADSVSRLNWETSGRRLRQRLDAIVHPQPLSLAS